MTGTPRTLDAVTVYLDHAATTPLRAEALAAMLPYLTEHFGNPSGAHRVARRATAAIDGARDEVAECLGCEPGEVVFTAGGTESDNLAVVGVARERGGSVLCSAVEHDAVLNACAGVGGATLPVTPTGVLDLVAAAAVLDGAGEDVALVSVMLANNEVGTVQPVAALVELVRAAAPRALVHCDAVAAVGWLDVAQACASADLLSVSGHKFGGPKGVGVLVVRGGAALAPVLHGGAQERGRRPGTQNVAAIVGMAAALRAATAERDAAVARVGRLRDRLADGLGAIPGVVETGVHPGSGSAPAGGAGRRAGKLASSCHLCVSGVDREELVLLLDEAGVCASAGAACASGAVEPSHVLAAMGVDKALARSALRLSLGTGTCEEDVDHVLSVMPKIVERLRA